MIVIVDYGLGNLKSVANALEAIHVSSTISRDPQDIKNASKLILPGVGAFGEGMDNLRKFGLVDLLNEEVLTKKKPFLGICLGMQLICKKSYEHGEFEGLGWIDAEVVRFQVEQTYKIPVPHVGWNDIYYKPTCPLFAGGRQPQTVYFVHSYYVLSKENVMAAECEYGIKFCAALQKDNIFATQFHPEKSQQEGLDILEKFANLEQPALC